MVYLLDYTIYKVKERLDFSVIIPFIYEMVYIPGHLVVSHLSLSLIPKYFTINRFGRSFLENSLERISELASPGEAHEIKRLYLVSQISLLPNIKYFTNTRNYPATLIKQFLWISPYLLIRAF